MASEKLWQRSELMGTQVITRDTGKRLGVVAEILVDVDRREVIALGLRDNILSRVVPGVPRYLYLSSIRQVGDVVLVDSDEAIEDIDISPYSLMVNSEVITESGEPLGRVRGFQFNIENGTLKSLVIASLGLPFVPEGVLSTYELPIDEIVSSGPDRIIVFEGAEERLQQITVGVLERLGIGSPPWERDAEDSYVLPTVPAENQLGTGLPTQASQPQTNSSYGQQSYGKPYRAPADDSWDDDNWEREPEPIPRELPRQEPQRRYLEAEAEPESGWSEASGNREIYTDDYGYEDDPAYNPPGRPAEPLGDAWADDNSAYKPKKLEIPEKQPQPEPEYEDGGY